MDLTKRRRLDENEARRRQEMPVVPPLAAGFSFPLPAGGLREIKPVSLEGTEESARKSLVRENDQKRAMRR